MEDGVVLKEKREEIIKEKMLDDAFKVAEVDRGLRPSDKKQKKRVYEKTFPKLGFLLLILAVIGLVIISNVPWAYLKYPVEEGYIETSIYRNFVYDETGFEQITSIFQSPNYIGVTATDLTDAPNAASSGFIVLIVLGIMVIVFGLMDKLLNFSIPVFILIHFIFGAAMIIPGLMIVLSSIKFLGVHLLIYYNASWISTPNVIVLFPAVFIIIALGFIIVKFAFTVMRMDFNELHKLKEMGEPKQTLFRSYGGELK